MIAESILAVFRQRLAGLPNPVTIDLYQSGTSGIVVPGRVQEPCRDCPATYETLEQIAGVSDNLRLRSQDYGVHGPRAEALGVDRIPGIVLSRDGGGPTDGRLRIFGRPAGHFLPLLLEAIQRTANDPDPPPADVALALEQIEGPIAVRVMASLTDKSATHAGTTAFTLATCTPRADAAVYAMESFPALVHDLEMTHTPLTFVNNSRGFAGVTMPLDLAVYALSSQVDRENPTAPRILDGTLGKVELKPRGGPEEPKSGLILPPTGIARPPGPGGRPAAPAAPVAPAAPRTAPVAPVPAPAPDLPSVDVAVIGGGPAGLQAALTLTRGRRSVAVFDDPAPARNAASHALHGYLGFDDLPPKEVRRVAWEQIDRYGGATLHEARVEDVQRSAGGDFVLHTRAGAALTAHHVVLASGYRDVYPDLSGFRECWGESIIPCVLCDGYEHRDRAWAIVRASATSRTTDPRLAMHWTKDVQLIQGGDAQLTDGEARRMNELGVRLHQGNVTGIRREGTQVRGVTLDSGAEVEMETLLWMPPSEPAPLVARLTRTLGLRLNAEGHVAADGGHRTSIERVWASGDVRGWAGAMGAARQGEVAAQAILHEWYQ